MKIEKKKCENQFTVNRCYKTLLVYDGIYVRRYKTVNKDIWNAYIVDIYLKKKKIAFVVECKYNINNDY